MAAKPETTNIYHNVVCSEWYQLPWYRPLPASKAGSHRITAAEIFEEA